MNQPWYLMPSKKENHVFLITGDPKVFGVNEFHLPRWLAEAAIKGHQAEQQEDLSEDDLEKIGAEDGIRP